MVTPNFFQMSCTMKTLLHLETNSQYLTPTSDKKKNFLSNYLASIKVFLK
tara:strand:- start:1196 stop:1345 length:150 start_codon:yes stop_codon:yes gene_type:complete